MDGECRTIGYSSMLAKENSLIYKLTGGILPPNVKIILSYNTPIVLQQPDIPIGIALHPILNQSTSNNGIEIGLKSWG